jgi:hypothetical protein
MGLVKRILKVNGIERKVIVDRKPFCPTSSASSSS